jgi:hypothetical protein
MSPGPITPATRAAAVAIAAASVLLLAGCFPGSPNDVASGTAPTPTPTPAASVDDRPWPEGASADTPRCVPASAATVAAVNVTITRPRPGEGSSVDELRAHADPDAAVWILTGRIAAGPDASLEVAWATTDDPTDPAFDGSLRSAGAMASTISDAPLLSLRVEDVADLTDGIPRDACH